MERVALLEKLFPPHMERLKANIRAGGEAGRDVNCAMSTRSAPEGSLLHRVEVLEEALDQLLAAQEVSLQYQQQLLTDSQNKKKGHAACCCCVM